MKSRILVLAILVFMLGACSRISWENDEPIDTAYAGTERSIECEFGHFDVLFEPPAPVETDIHIESSVEPETEPMTPPEISVNMLLEPTLDVDIVYCFNEGMAAVAVYSEMWWHCGSMMPGGLSAFFPFGYVNSRGEIVIPLEFCAAGSVPCAYDSPAQFSEGLVNISCHERNATGYFDVYGNLVVPFEHQFGEPFSNGLALVGNSTIEVVDGEYIEVFQWGFINKLGNVDIPLRFSNAQSFSEGLAAVYVNDIGWGYIDSTGNFVIEPRFSYAEPFTDELAAVALDGRWGVINRIGDVVIPFDFPVVYSAWDFRPRPRIYEGLLAIPVIRGQGLLGEEIGWDFIDMDINRVIAFAQGRNFSEGRLVVSSRISNALINAAVIDDGGNTIVSDDRYRNIRDFSEGLAAVNVNLGSGGYWGLVDGEWIYLNRWGFINRDGIEVIPATFRNALSFSQGLAAVQCFETRMWGFIDVMGEVVVPFIYDDARSFSEGIAWVKGGGYSNEEVPPTDINWYIRGGLWGLLQIDS